MSSEKHYVSVPVQHGERTRKVLSDFDLLDSEYKIISEDGILYLPTVTEVSLNQIKLHLTDTPLKIGKRYFENNIKGPRTLT
ncbi:MAG: hypothetical protein OEV85_10750, partial [Candidatus Thorarchaeota archaeon]|nr:hypothetical protein [Candidatus Thorarchaeota archaeon]